MNLKYERAHDFEGIVLEDDKEYSLCYLSTTTREEALRIIEFVNKVVEYNNVEKMK